MNDTAPEKPQPLEEKPGRLSENAARALAEAEARKAEIDAVNKANAGEQNGRGGLDPSRFGDWEVKGIATDF
ncbi:MAG: DUF1674 domain-containing protein [Hyphomicrobiaceae bacterium]|nr:DUF1674 domain-containing protein [Hyphomicrobiaceae bacterium]